MAGGSGKNREKKDRRGSNLPSGFVLPPQNLDSERGALGAVLSDKDAIVKIIDIITPEDFYDGRHGLIFEAMLTLFDKRRPIDLVTLSEILESEKKLEEVGGAG